MLLKVSGASEPMLLLLRSLRENGKVPVTSLTGDHGMTAS